MNDPMKLLKADHRAAEKILRQLSECEDPAERSTLVEQLAQDLSAHMAIEESLVYPLVASELDEEAEAEAEIEHGLAREGLEKLATMCDQPGFGAVVDMVTAGIQHHVKEEETELLPELKDSLDREAWSELGDRIAEERETAGLKTPTTPRRSSGRSAASAGSSRK